MENAQKKEKISEKPGSKTFYFNKINEDLSQNSLLSFNKGKKHKEKRINEIKQFNLTTDKTEKSINSINKKPKKKAEESFNYNFDSESYKDTSRNKKK
jgi:hypothetical protein